MKKVATRSFKITSLLVSFTFIAFPYTKTKAWVLRFWKALKAGLVLIPIHSQCVISANQTASISRSITRNLMWIQWTRQCRKCLAAKRKRHWDAKLTSRKLRSQNQTCSKCQWYQHRKETRSLLIRSTWCLRVKATKILTKIKREG